MVEFKELPVEIREKMLDEQVRQGNKRSAEVFDKNIDSNDGEGGFTWTQSVEGHAFWDKVLNGKVAIFYEKYPKA